MCLCVALLACVSMDGVIVERQGWAGAGEDRLGGGDWGAMTVFWAPAWRQGHGRKGWAGSGSRAAGGRRRTARLGLRF